jgi:hypothetical protein
LALGKVKERELKNKNQNQKLSEENFTKVKLKVSLIKTFKVM